MHQYADDTVLITNASIPALISLKLILRLFTAVSGLHINFTKSSWIPLNQNSDQITIISALLGCTRTNFPITYLGLPLTIDRPSNAAFMPLIERIESKLEGWQSKIISRGGRLLLMNTVLGSVPIYFMGSFLLPRWVIKKIDQIRRSFLWGRSAGKRGISLINWGAVCTPRQLGGMGGADLEKRNWALLLRWWWKLYGQQDSLWSRTIFSIRSITATRHKHRVWRVIGSFFWNHLLNLKQLFDQCTSWKIGSGASISYWFDNWTVPTMATIMAPLQENRTWSLQEAALRGLPLFASTVSEGEDLLQWNLNPNKTYSAGSFYRTICSIGRTVQGLPFIWRLNIPPTVKVFVYLCIQNRVLTQDVMLRRGIPSNRECVQCRGCPLETAMHLLFQCDYAAVFWNRYRVHLGFSLLNMGMSMEETVIKSYEGCRHMLTRKKWGVFFFAACWFLWRARNSKVFDNKCLPPTILADRVYKEARLWWQYC